MVTAQQIADAQFDAAAVGQQGYDEIPVDDFLDRVIETLESIERGRPLTAGHVTSAEVVEVEFPQTGASAAGGYNMDQVDDLLDLVARRLWENEQRSTRDAESIGAQPVAVPELTDQEPLGYERADDNAAAGRADEAAGDTERDEAVAGAGESGETSVDSDADDAAQVPFAEDVTAAESLDTEHNSFGTADAPRVTEPTETPHETVAKAGYAESSEQAQSMPAADKESAREILDEGPDSVTPRISSLGSGWSQAGSVDDLGAGRQDYAFGEDAATVQADDLHDASTLQTQHFGSAEGEESASEETFLNEEPRQDESVLADTLGDEAGTQPQQEEDFASAEPAEVVSAPASYPATNHRVPLPSTRSALSEADVEAGSHYHPEYSEYSSQETEFTREDRSASATDGQVSTASDVEYADGADAAPAGSDAKHDESFNIPALRSSEDGASRGVVDEESFGPAKAGEVGTPEPIGRPESIDEAAPLPPRVNSTRKGIFKRIFGG